MLLCFAVLPPSEFFSAPSDRPRDMMVRAITQQGDSGKMFGFMSNGHQLAGIIVPVLFGWIIDQGAVRMDFLAKRPI